MVVVVVVVVPVVVVVVVVVVGVEVVEVMVAVIVVVQMACPADTPGASQCPPQAPSRAGSHRGRTSSTTSAPVGGRLAALALLMIRISRPLDSYEGCKKGHVVLMNQGHINVIVLNHHIGLVWFGVFFRW